MLSAERNILLETLGKEINQQFSLPAEDMMSYQQILERLSSYLRSLLEKDFNQVIYLLYRIDVPEEKVTEILSNNPDRDADSMIASLILERILQKIKTRQQFSHHNKNIPDEEKW